MEYEFHPASDLFPLMVGEEFHSLIEDIRRQNLLEPIKLYEGKILDGRNRYKACLEAGKEPCFVDLPEDINPWEYVWSENAERRHLQEGQKAIIRLFQLGASEVWEGEKQRRKEEANRKRSEAVAEVAARRERTEAGTFAPSPVSPDTGLGDNDKPDDYERERTQVAKATGVGEATAGRALAVYHKRSDLAEKVRKGDISLNEASRLMKKDEVASKIGKLPEGKFRVIYADPPWKYDSGGPGIDQYGPAERHYPSMSISELCAMDVKSRAADDAVLFLWVTSPMLAECWEVILAWGFIYKASFIWNKIRHNYGHYNSVRHELLLVCTKGSCVPDNNTLLNSVVSIQRGEHSEKPEEFRRMIEVMYKGDERTRLEIFARKKILGWTCYGNEMLTGDENDTLLQNST